MSCVVRGALFAVAFLVMTEHTTVGSAYESSGPEAAIRTLVRANAELGGVLALMAYRPPRPI